MTKTEIINLPTSSLAYLGDSVLELLVREKLILAGGETISLTPLYCATRELQQRSEDFLTKLS